MHSNTRFVSICKKFFEILIVKGSRRERQLPLGIYVLEEN